MGMGGGGGGMEMRVEELGGGGGGVFDEQAVVGGGVFDEEAVGGGWEEEGRYGQGGEEEEEEGRGSSSEGEGTDDERERMHFLRGLHLEDRMEELAGLAGLAGCGWRRGGVGVRRRCYERRRRGCAWACVRHPYPRPRTCTRRLTCGPRERWLHTRA